MTTTFTQTIATDHEADYLVLTDLVRKRFETFPAPLFVTSLTSDGDLFDAFLKALPEGLRQHYDCHACRHFINHYGGLVYFNEMGDQFPVLWNLVHAPATFRESFRLLYAIVRTRPVRGVFYAKDGVLGTPCNKDAKRSTTWHHLHARVTEGCFAPPAGKTPQQATLESLHTYQTFAKGLARTTLPLLRKACALLEEGQLTRAEKFVGWARWLLNTKKATSEAKGSQRNNVLWAAVAKAPVGWCTFRSSVLGALIEDLAAAAPMTVIERHWNERVGAHNYQRPKAAPTSGAIREAERLVEELDIARSLERRFAHIEECLLDWRPMPTYPEDKGGGVFGHLKPKGSEDRGLTLREHTMTWIKFAAEVLPRALAIEVSVPSHGNFTALTTAVHADAPPILQWDHEEQRNPVSNYVLHGGSYAGRWGLRAGSWVPVTGVCRAPERWYEDNPRHTEAAFILIKGARDSKSNSLALFPETLKASLHGVRSVIEAHSNSRGLEGYDEASACGIMVNSPTAGCPLVLRIQTELATGVYKIDRWD